MIWSWLTKEEKESTLIDLAFEILAGNIDEPFLPYLLLINSTAGVCTVQCCSGHGAEPGNLSMRISEWRDVERTVEELVVIEGVYWAEMAYECEDSVISPRLIVHFDTDTCESVLRGIYRMLSLGSISL